MPNENNGQFSISNIQVKTQEISNFKREQWSIFNIQYPSEIARNFKFQISNTNNMQDSIYNKIARNCIG